MDVMRDYSTYIQTIMGVDFLPGNLLEYTCPSNASIDHRYGPEAIVMIYRHLPRIIAGPD